MRIVGDIDLVYTYLFFEGENSLSPSPALSSCLGFRCRGYCWRTDPSGSRPAERKSISQLSKEWAAIKLRRPCNHGFFEEALLVSFALLDALSKTS